MKKALKIVIPIMLSFGVLTGCGKADEIALLQQQNAALVAQVSELTVQLEEASTISEIMVEPSLQIVAGSSEKSFKLIEGMLNFPTALTFPEGFSKSDASNSLIRVGSRYVYYPADNWVVQLGGSELKLSHPTNIWGSIKSVLMLESVTEDQIMTQFKDFFNGFPSTTITYSFMYMDSAKVGVLARAPIKVEGEDYVINIGLMYKGEYGQVYLFTYKDDKTGVQQELINSLIRTGKSGDIPIVFD